LDRNGSLDIENTAIGGNIGYDASPGNGGVLTPTINPISFDPTRPNLVDFTGWKFVRVPLNISSTTASNWSAIKEIRISLKRGATATRSGSISIAKIAVVGNKWQTDNGVETSTITS